MTPEWIERFTQLVNGQAPTVKGWSAGKSTDPTWVNGHDLTHAYYTLHKGNQYRVYDEHANQVWPPNKGSEHLCGIFAAINHYGQGPPESETWWSFGDLYRYYHPWAHHNAPIQQHLYLSPGQLRFLRTGKGAGELADEGFSTYWPREVTA